MAKRGRKKKQQSAAPASAEPRQRGRKSQYDAETKAAILKACADARKAGMTWGDALDASRAAGFKGTLPYLMKIARDSGQVEIRRRRRGRGKAAAGRGPGRPPKAIGRNGTAASMGEIERVVAEMVETRVSAAISRAAATLEKTAAELRKL